MEKTLEKELVLPSKFITVLDYSVEKQLTVQAIYKQIKSGKLKTKRIGSFILIDLN